MSNSHKIGYEIESKQVRHYEINDLESVRRAIAVNTQEYLTFSGVQENQPFSFTALLAPIAAISIGVYIFFAKVSFHTTPLLTAGCFLTFLLLSGGMLVNAMIQSSADLIFVSSGAISADREVAPPFTSFRGKTLRVFLKMKPFSPDVTLAVQVTGKPRLFSSPKVIHSVEKTTQYGKFFGSTGFFYPPALTREINLLLEQLADSKKVKKAV